MRLKIKSKIKFFTILLLGLTALLFLVGCKEPIPTSLEIDTSIERIEVIEGENLGLEAFSFFAVYKNGSREEIDKSLLNLSGFDSSIEFLSNDPVKQTLTFTYEGLTKTIDIYIIPKEIESIFVLAGDGKSRYLVNEELDLTGYNLFVTYKSGETKEIPLTKDHIINYNTLPIVDGKLQVDGNYTLEVSYRGNLASNNTKIIVSKYSHVDEQIELISNTSVINPDVNYTSNTPNISRIEVSPVTNGKYKIIKLLEGEPVEEASAKPWQDSPVFDDLEPNQEYRIIALQGGSDTFYEGSTYYLDVTTKKVEAPTPVILSYGYNYIEVKREKYVEYTLNRHSIIESSPNSIRFTNLEPNYEYTITSNYEFEYEDTQIIKKSITKRLEVIDNPFNHALNQTVVFNNQPVNFNTSLQDEFKNSGNIITEITYNGSTEVPVDAGTYQIKIKHRFSPNVLSAGTLIITKLLVQGAVNNCEKAYYDQDPAFTYQINSEMPLGFDLSSINAVFSRVQGEEVGTYQIQASLSHKNLNFQITPGMLTIKQKVIYAHVNNSEKIYGELLPSPSYELLGDTPKFHLGHDETFIAKFTYTTLGINEDKYLDSGTYLNQINLELTNTSYKVIVNNSGSIIVRPRAITLTIHHKQKVYGADDPVLTYELSNENYRSRLGAVLQREAGNNAGTYQINLQGYNSHNFNVTVVSNNLVITKAQITFKVNDFEVIYGDNYKDLASLSITSGWLVASDKLSDFNITYHNLLSLTVGTYELGANITNSNYDITVVSGNVTVVPKEVSVIPTPSQKKVYGEVDPNFEYQVYGLIPGDTVNLQLGRVSGEDAGLYKFTLPTSGLNENYTYKLKDTNFEITKKTINVTPTAGQTKVYGEANPGTYTYTYTPELIDGDSFSGSLVRVSGENVGTYAIVQGNLSLSTNYTLTFTTGVTFEIKQRTITVTPHSGKTKVYGQTDPTFTYDHTPLVGSDSFNGELSRNDVTNQNVGTYGINQGNLTLSTNYVIVFVDTVTFVITPKPVTVTPDSGKTKIYGESDPVFTYTHTGIVLGDSFEGALSRDDVENQNVGTYNINIGTLKLSANYTLTLDANIVTFEITKKTINVTPNAGQSKEYGDSDPTTFTYVTDEELVAGDSFTGKLGRTSGEAVGTYAIDQGNLSLSTNYTLIFTSGVTFEIKKKDIKIIADDKNRKVNEENPVFTANLDELATLDETFNPQDLVFSTDANSSSPVGDYDIVVSGSFTSSNYNFIYIPGKLTISPEAFNHSITQKYTYNGEVQNIEIILTDDNQNDVTADYEITRIYQGGLTPLNAGVYEVDILIVGGGHNITIPAIQEIMKKEISVDYGIGDTFVYGDPYSVHQATSASLITGHRIELIGDMSGIGEKTLSIRILNSSNHVVTSNYAVTNPTCTFEILKATLTITPTKLWKTYGEEDGVLTYLVSGLKKNDTTQVINGVLARDLGEVVDTYEFSVNDLSADHYNFVLVQNAPKFEIRKKPITVTYNLLDSYTYGDTITKAPTVSEGLLLGHTIVIEDDLSNAGTYVINPHIYDSLNNNVTSNYLITNNGFVLVINTKELIITSESKSKYYGEDDPLIGYTVSGYVNGENNLVMGNISRVEGELAGSYNILIDSLDLQSTNYHLTLVPNTFTINQKSISFTFNSNTYTYQGEVFNIVLSSTELLPTDTITILNNTFVDAGTYQLQVKITNGLVDVTSSYLINNDSLVFTITPKEIRSVLWSYDNILATATSPDLVLGEEFSYEDNDILIPGFHTATILDNTNYTFENESDKSYQYENIGTISVNIIPEEKTYNGLAQKYDISYLEALGYTVTEDINLEYVDVNNYPVKLTLSKDHYYDLTVETSFSIVEKEVIAYYAYSSEYVYSGDSYLNNSNVVLSETLSSGDYTIKNYKLVNGVLGEEVFNFTEVGKYRVVYTITNTNYKASQINYFDIEIIKANIEIVASNQLLISGQEFIEPSYQTLFAKPIVVTFNTTNLTEISPVTGLTVGTNRVVITKIMLNGNDVTNQFDFTEVVYEYTFISKDYVSLMNYNKNDFDREEGNEFSNGMVEGIKNPEVGFGYRYQNKYYANMYNSGVLNPNFSTFASNYYYKVGNLNPATIYLNGLIDLESLELNNIKVIGNGVTLLGINTVDLTSSDIHAGARKTQIGLKVSFSQVGKQQIWIAYEKYSKQIILAKLNVEVVDGFTNITKYEELFNSSNQTIQNIVLNNGIAYLQTLGVTINVGADKTLYGNNYEINSYSAAYSDKYKPQDGGKNLINTAGTIDNVRIIQRKTDSYESAGAGNRTINSDTAVTFTGGIIKNSFITGGRESIEIPNTATGDLTILNSTILSGPFGIRRRGGGRLILIDSKVIARTDKDFMIKVNDPNDPFNVTGMGIPIVYLNNTGYNINELDIDNIYLDFVGNTKIYAFETKENIKGAPLPFGVKDVVGGIIDDLWQTFENQLVYDRGSEAVMAPAVMFVSPVDIKTNLEGTNPIDNFATIFQHAYKNITIAQGYGYVYTYNKVEQIETEPGVFVQRYSPAFVESEGLFNPPSYHMFTGEYKGD